MKRLSKSYFVVGVVMVAVSLAVASWVDGHVTMPGDLREGDVIFQPSISSQAQAIELATHSRYSHCGIIFKLKGEWYVYEAVGPVRYTPIKEWIARGKGGKYAIKRLKNADKILTLEAVGKLKKVGVKFKGKPYDFAFNWSDERIYCSELIYKIYKNALGLEVSEIKRLGEFDLTHPAVRQKLIERYGDNIPLDEPVVPPQALFESPLFVTVD